MCVSDTPNYLVPDLCLTACSLIMGVQLIMSYFKELGNDDAKMFQLYHNAEYREMIILCLYLLK